MQITRQMAPKLKHEKAIYQACLSAKQTPSHKPAKTALRFKQSKLEGMKRLSFTNLSLDV